MHVECAFWDFASLLHVALITSFLFVFILAIFWLVLVFILLIFSLFHFFFLFFFFVFVLFLFCVSLPFLNCSFGTKVRFSLRFTGKHTKKPSKLIWMWVRYIDFINLWKDVLDKLLNPLRYFKVSTSTFRLGINSVLLLLKIR